MVSCAIFEQDCPMICSNFVFHHSGSSGDKDKRSHLHTTYVKSCFAVTFKCTKQPTLQNFLSLGLLLLSRFDVFFQEFLFGVPGQESRK